jgi:NADPH-dependent curcumin reductase CurA
MSTANLTQLVNHQIRLAARPVGMPKATVKTLALSLDPAMRGWMNEGKSYIPPVGIGEVMRAGGVGVVVASEARASRGRLRERRLGVQEYCTHGRPAMIKRNGLSQDRPARAR